MVRRKILRKNAAKKHVAKEFSSSVGFNPIQLSSVKPYQPPFRKAYLSFCIGYAVNFKGA